jgi:PKD repeat protein
MKRFSLGLALVCAGACWFLPSPGFSAETGLAAWGANGDNDPLLSPPVAVWTDAESISAGATHGLAAKNGTVYAWGDNSHGQCTIPIAASSAVKQVSASIRIPLPDDDLDKPVDSFSVALRSDGEVLVWGDDPDKALRVCESKYIPDDVKAKGVSAVAAGGEHVLALKNGRVYAWGSIHYAVTSSIPAAVSSGIKAIDAGGYFGMALSSNGTVYVWGDPEDAGPSVNVADAANIPAAVKAGGVSAIAAGTYHALALKGGAVYAWGENPAAIEVPAEASSGVEKIAAGDCISLALKSDGSIVAWGDSWVSDDMPSVAAGGVAELSAGSFAMVRSSRMAPVFTNASVIAANGTVAAPYSQTPTAAIGIPDPTYLKGTNWPSWLSLDAATGTLSGTPAEAGTYTFPLVASNQWGTEKASITIYVYEQQIPPTWVWPTDPTQIATAYVGVAYSARLQATGNPDPTYRRTPDTPILPGGLNLSSDGLLAGTPTEATTNRPFYLEAVNTAGTNRIQGVWNITAPVAPTLTTAALPGGTQGVSYEEFQLEATGSIPANGFTYSATSLPDGMTLSESGILSGTPAESGTFLVSIVVHGVVLANGTRLDSNPAVRPLIIAATAPPTLVAQDLPAARVGTAYEAAVTATGSAPITYSATGLPGGLAFSEDGVLSGTPTTPGTYSIAVTATNFRGSDTATYPLVVEPDTILPDEIPFGPVSFANGKLVLQWQNPTNDTYVVELWTAPNVFALDPLVPNGTNQNLGVQISPWTTTIDTTPAFFRLRARPK